MKKILTGLFFCFFSAFAYAGNYSSYVFFGDSLSDVGNNRCYTDNDATIGCGTWANYLNYNEFKTPVQASSRGGTDYAVSGDTSDHTLAIVQQYVKSHGGSVDPNAYYFILTGGNDFINAIQTAVPEEVKKMKAQNMDIFSAIANFNAWLVSAPGGLNPNGGPVYNQQQAAIALQAAGAKHIMVIDLFDPSIAPMSAPFMSQLNNACTLLPSMFQQNCQAIVKTMPDVYARDYNGTLASYLRVDQNTAVVQTFSMHAFFNELLAQGYNACTENTAGCTNGLFFDDRHPVASAHAKMAAAIQAMISPD